jgi:hypothetical protein
VPTSHIHQKILKLPVSQILFKPRVFATYATLEYCEQSSHITLILCKLWRIM